LAAQPSHCIARLGRHDDAIRAPPARLLSPGCGSAPQEEDRDPGKGAVCPWAGHGITASDTG